MDQLENLNKSIDAWAKRVKITTHQTLAKASFLTMLKKNPAVSSFSNCLLIISVATAILMISNLAEITTIIPPVSIKSILFILILSATASFLAKGISRYIDILLRINENINELISKILKQSDSFEEEMKKITRNFTEPPSKEINLKLVLKKFTQVSPGWYRTKLFKVAKESATDPLWAHKRQAKLLLTMRVAAIMQVKH